MNASSTATTPVAPMSCSAWCLTDHSGDTHGEHFHRGERRHFEALNGETTYAQLASFTADDCQVDPTTVVVDDVHLSRERFLALSHGHADLLVAMRGPAARRVG